VIAVAANVGGFLLTLKAELVLYFIYAKRYIFATLFQAVLAYFVIVYFLLNQDLFGSGNGSEQGTKLVGFLMWMFASQAIGLFTGQIRSAAETGVLEQLCLSPHGLVTIFCARAVGVTSFQFLYVGILYTLVTRTQEIPVNLAPASVALVLVMTLVGLYGVGFILGGLSLMFKRIGQVAILLRIFLLFVVFSPNVFDPGYTGQLLPFKIPLSFVPLYPGTSMLKLLMAPDGTGAATSLLELAKSGELWLLVINSGLWFAIGVGIFKLCENVSRDRGGLGTY